MSKTDKDVKPLQAEDVVALSLGASENPRPPSFIKPKLESDDAGWLRWLCDPRHPLALLKVLVSATINGEGTVAYHMTQLLGNRFLRLAHMSKVGGVGTFVEVDLGL